MEPVRHGQVDSCIGSVGDGIEVQSVSLTNNVVQLTVRHLLQLIERNGHEVTGRGVQRLLFRMPQACVASTGLPDSVTPLN